MTPNPGYLALLANAYRDLIGRDNPQTGATYTAREAWARVRDLYDATSADTRAAQRVLAAGQAFGQRIAALAPERTIRQARGRLGITGPTVGIPFTFSRMEKDSPRKASWHLVESPVTLTMLWDTTGADLAAAAEQHMAAYAAANPHLEVRGESMTSQAVIY